MTKRAIIGQVGLALLVAAACSSSPEKNKDAGVPSTPGNSTGGNMGIVVPQDGGDLDAQAPPEQPQVDMVQVDSVAGVEDACSGIAKGTEPKPVVLQMVVDVSSSMGLPAPNTTATKWSITRDALVGAMGSLPESVWIGVQFFPNKRTDTYSATPQQPHTACVNQANNVGIAPLGPPGSGQRAAIDSAFGAITLVTGAGTPTLDAYLLALQPIYNSTNLPTDQFTLLITDGQPTYAEFCVGDGVPHVSNPSLQDLTDPIVNQIGVANAAGIQTFVIGSPGSEVGADTSIDARPWMSRAARAGGTDLAGCVDTGPNFCHFDMSQSQDFAGDLGLALQKIANTLVTCFYDVPAVDGATIDVSKTSLYFTAGDQTVWVLTQNLSATCDLGWHYTDATKTQIEICGKTCDKIRSDPGASMDVLFGCESPVVVQ
jgi:hypothetical protein